MARSIQELREWVGEVFGDTEEAVVEVSGVKEEEMPEERVPFDVHEPIEVGDLSDVQERRTVLPPTDNVLLTIQKANLRQSRDAATKSLHLELKLVEGIDENGKYRGMVLFEDVPIWADFTVERIAVSRWYQEKNYLVPLRYLKVALGHDVKEALTISDEFCVGLMGRQVRARVTTENERTFDESTGEWVDTGNLRNRVKNFQPA